MSAQQLSTFRCVSTVLDAFFLLHLSFANEPFPTTGQTAGWGSLEYGGRVPHGGSGVIVGGRWKPSHYTLRHVFADVLVACGWLGTADRVAGPTFQCFLKNDSPWAVPFARGGAVISFPFSPSY